MPKFRLAIFDLDGTLIDSSPGIIKAAQKSLSVLGQEEMPYEQLKSCIGPPIAETIGKLRNYSDKDKDEFYKVFRPLYSSKYLMEMEIYPGIVELLKKLKSDGIKLGIATNKREDYANKLLEEVGLAPLFDSIQCLDMGNKFKKVDLIRKCIDDIGMKPEDTVMIGDTENDLKAAIEAGTSFIAALYGYGFEDEKVLESHSSVVAVSELYNLIN